MNKDLDTARLLDHGISATPGEQMVRETRSHTAGHVARAIGGAAAGGVLGAATGVPFLAEAGALAGGALGAKIAGKPRTSAVTRYFGRGLDKDGQSRLTTPNEAHAVLEDTQRYLNRSTPLNLTAANSARGTSAALQSAVSAFLAERDRRKREAAK